MNQHPDDLAVDKFAAAMKVKLAQARAKGRGGLENCEPSELSRMLREHVEKGDPLDIANFCMFLWSLGYPIITQPTPAAAINEKTLSELKNMVRAYVRLLEAGKDRIQSLGGDCDPVDRMEAGDSNLRTAKAAIAAAEAEKAKGGK